MADQNQIMDSVIATPRASSNGSIFWVTPTQFNPQTGTYQTHYYSDDLVKSGTVSVGTPTWKNNSMVSHGIPSSNINGKSVAAPVLIPPPQTRNLANFEDPVIRIPDGIKELEYEDDDDQSVVDIKQLNQSFDYDSENGDNSNRAKNVVDAVVALGHVLVKDLQKAVPNFKSSGSSIFESCLAGSNASGLENELAFSPKNILRDTLRSSVQVRPHLLPNEVTMQELIASGGGNTGNSPDKRLRKTAGLLASSTLLSSELFFDQSKFPRLSLVTYEPSVAGGGNVLALNKEALKRLNSDFGDSPLCFISLVDCPSDLFSTLLLNPDLESSSVQKVINKEFSERQQHVATGTIPNSLVDMYYWYKDDEFIYVLLDFKVSVVPKLHDILLILANSISSTVVMNNSGVINHQSLMKLRAITELQKEFESRQEKIINKLVREDCKSGVGNMKSDDFSTPAREVGEDYSRDDFKTAQGNPLLLLTPRYKPTLKSETVNDFKQVGSQDYDKGVNHSAHRTLLCALKTTPRPYLVWLLHDFNFLLYDTANGMILNSIDYFETLMTELGCGYECEDSQVTYFENLKLYLRSYYTMKECHTLVSPYTIENNERKVRTDHMKQVSCLRQRLLGISRNHAMSHKLGQYNSSLTINRYLSIFFKVLGSNETESLSELNEVVQRRFCDKILMDVNDYYVAENKKLVESLPMNEAALKDVIKEIKSKCMHLYKEYTSTLIDTDIYIDYKIQLQLELQERENETMKGNLDISVRYCTTYLNEMAKKSIISKLYDGVRSSSTSMEGLSNKIGSSNSSTSGSLGGGGGGGAAAVRRRYSILDLERDLEEVYTTMLNSLDERIPREISLNCFLKVANELRHEWYQANGGGGGGVLGQGSVGGVKGGGDKIGIENCFGASNGGGGGNRLDDELVRRMETPEMLVSRLNADLEDIDSEYSGYSLMQKKELLEDILLEATKKKDRLSDFYPSDQLYDLDCLIAATQERLDVVNTERRSILENNEMQRQMILKQKQKRWRKLFPCLKKNISYNSNYLSSNSNANNYSSSNDNNNNNNNNSIQGNDNAMNHSVDESY